MCCAVAGQAERREREKQSRVPSEGGERTSLKIATGCLVLRLRQPRLSLFCTRWFLPRSAFRHMWPFSAAEERQEKTEEGEQRKTSFFFCFFLNES